MKKLLGLIKASNSFDKGAHVFAEEDTRVGMLFRKCDSLWISYLTYVHGKVLHDNNGAGKRKVHHKLFTKDRRFMQDRTDNANSSVFRNKLIYLICITLCRKISLANSASSELALANRILCLL